MEQEKPAQTTPFHHPGRKGSPETTSSNPRMAFVARVRHWIPLFPKITSTCSWQALGTHSWDYFFPLFQRVLNFHLPSPVSRCSAVPRSHQNPHWERAGQDLLLFLGNYGYFGVLLQPSPLWGEKGGCEWHSFYLAPKYPPPKIHLHLKGRKWHQDPGNALFLGIGRGFSY